MRVVLQRVLSASVRAAESGEVMGSTGPGLLVLAGFAEDDGEPDLNWMVEKILHLRIFNDDQGRMNHSLLDAGGSLLVVSQFTLMADCRKGRRPSFQKAGSPEEGEKLYEQFVRLLKQGCARTETGRFRSHMHVELVNDGPVTIILDSSERKGG